MTRCAHCGGSLYRDDGDIKCLACARTVSTAETGTIYRKCPQGHLITPENTVWRREKRGGGLREVCKLCYEEEKRYAAMVRNTVKGEPIHLFGKTPVEDWMMKVVRR